LLSLVLVGCSSSTFEVAPGSDAAPADSTVGDTSAAVDSQPSDTHTSADVPVTTEAAVDANKADAMCVPASFPTFLRGCTLNADCAFGLHQRDCCGNETAIGFSASQKPVFEEAEKNYRMVCPATCECPIGPITTETGKTTTDVTQIIAICFGTVEPRTCKSTVK
jgi:hypothetical protein